MSKNISDRVVAMLTLLGEDAMARTRNRCILSNREKKDARGYIDAWLRSMPCCPILLGTTPKMAVEDLPETYSWPWGDGFNREEYLLQ